MEKVETKITKTITEEAEFFKEAKIDGRIEEMGLKIGNPMIKGSLRER